PFTSYIYTLSLHDALPILYCLCCRSNSLRCCLSLSAGEKDFFSDFTLVTLVASVSLVEEVSSVEPVRRLKRELERDGVSIPNPEDRKSTRLNSSHLGISYA